MSLKKLPDAQPFCFCLFLEQLKNLSEANEGQTSTSHRVAETVRIRAEEPENIKKNQKTQNMQKSVKKPQQSFA